jgi:hypothetical protein
MAKISHTKIKQPSFAEKMPKLTYTEISRFTGYVIKFVSDFRQIGGFHQVLRYPPPIKLTDITEILLKVALNIMHNP